MASSREYLDFVLEQLEGISGIDYKKMFGEYLIYINNKPAIMVCDNTPMVKKLPELLELMQGAPDEVRVHAVDRLGLAGPSAGATPSGR